MSRKRTVVLVCALAVMVAAIALIIVVAVSREEAGDIYEDLQSQVTIPPVTEPDSSEPPDTKPDEPETPPTEPEPEAPSVGPEEPEEPKEPYVSPINFESLRKTNEDIYAWITIPDMDVISYPVVQHPTDDTYYLKHTIEGREGFPASIYTEKWNSKDFTDRVTIIYGHNMADGTMFGPLYRFSSSTYMREHRIISLYTPEGEFHYRIWASVTYSDAYLPYVFDLTTEEGVGAFIRSIQNVRDLNSFVDSEVEVSETDRFVVLSTCRPDNRYRLLVVGVLDEELSTK